MSTTITAANFADYPNFSAEEFDSPDAPGSGKRMKKAFMQMLQNARTLADFPFFINSGFRTKAHNEDEGGAEDSPHLYGYAADIACTGSRSRFILVDALAKAGFTRIGIGKTFVHADCDPTKDQRVIWVY